MRQGMVGAAVGVLLGLVGWLMADTGLDRSVDTFAERPGSGEVVAFQVTGQEGVHLYIVDGRRHWFGVYQLDLNSGDCRLKVARDFSGDLELLEAGGEHEPPARAVKQMIQRVRQR